ncbi:hypothetical protein DW650_04995 [Roseburia sp. AM23-20]|jgi:hypothetical protein|uniref:DUF6128 domain-containing protein n=1 Tax=Roseburia sp. AM23-20 TaxID=2292066 RepID=UPI000E545BF0|nr:DUF6128 domain-containing protein [Roseburia sp. AM23-20]RHF96024.1 hypothetical protein DW650_04995 [Roseburia sp. AM23-20]
MAGMKRFITYIYAYENTKKAGNTGFARIELRGEECRLEIHLRGVYAAQTHCKIYLFRKQGSGIEGSLIGEMDVRNGAGDFSVIMKTAHISTSLLSFFEMEGIFLCSEDGRIFMSRWTEGEPLTVDMEHFIEWKAEQTEENIYAEEKQQENKIQTAQFDRESDNELRATELPARNFFPQYQWKDIWEQFLKSHPASMPFSEKNITCIKIELKDIRELPRKYWYLGNNSFLLHGFFNYRYLVLGKIEEDNEDKWFLGVPGIYQNQERVMAIIFGFPEFMPEQVENRFGCWYRFIEE